MNDQKKTKNQLIAELTALRKQIAKADGLEKSRPGAPAAVPNPTVFYKHLLENIDEGILVMDKDDRIFFVNDPMARIAGVLKEQILGARVLRDFSEDTVRYFKSYYLEAKESLHTVSYDSIAVFTPAGRMTYQSGILVPMVKDGRFDGMICTILDHTERKQAQEELQAWIHRYELIVAASGQVTYECIASTGHISWDPSIEKVLGYTLEEINGGYLQWQNLLHPEDRDATMAALDAAQKALAYWDVCYRLRHKRGDYVWIRDRGFFLPDAAGKACRRLGMLEDITERRRAEEALKESEANYRQLFENSPAAIYRVDFRSGKFIKVNDVFRGYLGYSDEEIASLSPYDILTEESKKLFLDRLGKMASGEKVSETVEYEVVGKKGKHWRLLLHNRNIYDAEGHVVGSDVVAHDITELKRAEQEKNKLSIQLNQSQKMESVGRLAGGVAHDFNNMLSVIIGNTEVAMEKVAPAEPLYKALQGILNAGMRSADLTRQLLAFARKQTVSPKVLDLNGTVTGMLKMLKRLIGENIDLGWHPGPNLWKVKIDPSQVDQLLANLTVNARDAIEKTGRITIETSNTTCDEASCSAHAEFIPGEYVLLVVSDDGCGMEKETLSNIYEPFFTTKKEGQGTGLGLSTVYGIVKQNGGFIYADSEPGRGATFRIYLPRYRVERPEVAEDKVVMNALGGTETVLVVEDEASVLSLTKGMLEMLGYKVLAARGGDQALKLFKEHAGNIDLLLTDVVMPHMNGKELLERIIAIKPGLKCLYMSGYTADVIARQGILDEGVQFICKPFFLKELAAKLREAIG